MAQAGESLAGNDSLGCLAYAIYRLVRSGRLPFCFRIVRVDSHFTQARIAPRQGRITSLALEVHFDGLPTRNEIAGLLH